MGAFSVVWIRFGASCAVWGLNDLEWIFSEVDMGQAGHYFETAETSIGLLWARKNSR